MLYPMLHELIFGDVDPPSLYALALGIDDLKDLYNNLYEKFTKAGDNTRDMRE